MAPPNPGWLPSGTREELLEQFSDYHPQFQALFAKLPERLPRWQLRFLPVLPTWVRGYAALLGDAAHATLPGEFFVLFRDNVARRRR